MNFLIGATGEMILVVNALLDPFPKTRRISLQLCFLYGIFLGLVMFLLSRIYKMKRHFNLQVDVFQWSCDEALLLLNLYFFNRDETRSDSKDIGKSYSITSKWNLLWKADNQFSSCREYISIYCANSYRRQGLILGAKVNCYSLNSFLLLLLREYVVLLIQQSTCNWRIRSYFGLAGGLLGGTAASWLLFPAWKLESLSRNGRTAFTEGEPVFSIIKRHIK